MIDFCIYEPGQEDYWGQVSNINDIRQFVPDFDGYLWYRPELSNDVRAIYQKGCVEIVCQIK